MSGIQVHATAIVDEAAGRRRNARLALRPHMRRRQARAALGANCTIVCGATIGHGAFVGAGLVVTSDWPHFALVSGVPGRHAAWMSRFGKRLLLPLHGGGETLYTRTRSLDRIDGMMLQLIPERPRR